MPYVDFSSLRWSDWVELAEEIEPIQVKGKALSDSLFNAIAESASDDELIKEALEGWKTEAPERFKSLLEAE